MNIKKLCSSWLVIFIHFYPAQKSSSNKQEFAYILIKATSSVFYAAVLHAGGTTVKKNESKRTRQQRVNATRKDGIREPTGLASGKTKLILCKPCVRPGIYGGCFATSIRPPGTLELLFARSRSFRERQDNPESSCRSAFPGTGSNRVRYPNSI